MGRIRRPHTLYATVIRTYLKRADHRIVKLTDIRIALDTAYAGLLLEKSDAYVDYAHRLRDPVECRLLKGETIPQDEKIFSVFEPHTRWIAKGPDRRLPAPRWNSGCRSVSLRTNISSFSAIRSSGRAATGTVLFHWWSV